MKPVNKPHSSRSSWRSPVLAAIAVALTLAAVALVTCQEQFGRGTKHSANPQEQEPQPDSNLQHARQPRPEFVNEVTTLIAAGRNDLARLRLQSVLSRNPNDGHAQFLFGLTFHRELRYARAREHFERAIELVPDYPPVHHFYGYCLYNLGELSAARQAFEKHLSYRPREGDSHFGLGLIDLAEDELDAAEDRFLRAIELDELAGRTEGVAKARARLGETYELMGRLENARGQLETATALNPDLYEAFYILYRVLNRMGDEEAAARALADHEAAKQRVRPDPASAPSPPAPPEP